MKKITKVLSIIISFIFVVSIAAACSPENKPGEKQVEITFWGANTQYNTAQFKQLVDGYNAGQGIIDGVYVRYSPKGGDYSSSLSNILRSKSAPNVCMIGDKYFKAYAMQGLLLNLEDYISNESTYSKDAEGNNLFNLNDMSANTVYRYRFDKDHNTAGADVSPLYAIPNGCVPTVLYYNEDMFAAQNINVISVAEEDLDEYNLANGTNFMPHGYAEYTVESSPKSDLKKSETLTGETVIKVFNNQIAMNWNELVALSRYFTQSYNSSATSSYGFLSEWWFPYGWSVGGDCIQWDSTIGKYVFSLGDKNANYIVTTDATINGNDYTAGQILSYNDMEAVVSDPGTLISDGTLYAIPSQYEAFAEFCSLYQKRDEAVDSEGIKGYGIAPNPTEVNANRTGYFTSGKCAMVIESYNQANTVNKSVSFEWSLAPAWQYREYEGGDTVGKMNGTKGELKIIGRTYNGELYTGELKKVNGTKIVGYKAASSLNTGVAISARTDNEKKLAAWKFVQYLTGTAGQKILSGGNDMIPNGVSYTESDNFECAYKNRNVIAAIKAAQYTTIMDECYLTDQTWVDHWADVLNTDVRGGAMLIDTFFDNVTARANEDLINYTVRLIRR